MSTAGPRAVTDPAELVTLFEADRDCHVYGLADLAEPFWHGSTWWRRGDAAVGVVPLPDSEEVAFYAVSPRAPADTIELLVRLHDHVPAGAVGSAPLGFSRRMAANRPLDDLGTRRKMVVQAPCRRPPPVPAGMVVRTLDDHDHDMLVALHATDPGSVFFVRSMLEDGRYLGVEDDDGRLLAAAGTHVLERTHAVAAIGAVITDPDHRGRGLAGAVVARLAAGLLAEDLTVGLNVGDDNLAAIRVYQHLGFRTVHRYEEARLR